MKSHDPAYKQEAGVHYHASAMAVSRAYCENPGGAVVGDAVARDRSQCAARRYARLTLPGAVRRPAHAVG